MLTGLKTGTRNSHLYMYMYSRVS